MAEKHHVKGYDGFVEFMKDFKANGKILNILFSGEKDDKVRICKEFDFYFYNAGCSNNLFLREHHGAQIALKRSLL